MMKTELWIDLEQTIIPSWDQINFFINLDKLDNVIKEYKPESIGIYSYAIHNKENLEILEDSEIVSYLSRRVTNEIKIHTTYQMDEDRLSHHKHAYGGLSATTIWQIPKEYAFLMSVNNFNKKGSNIERFVLLDDTAPHEKIYNINSSLQVHFLNPDNIII